MKLADAITPVTQLKTRSAELIRQARETGQPIIITQNGRATAVLQDVASYQRQRDALLMLKLIAQGAAELQAGAAIPHEEALSRIERHLAALPDDD